MLELWGDGARRIHAFEPDPGSAARFQAWLDGSPHRERVRLHRVALGSEPGSLRFPGTGALDAAGGAEGVEVPLRTLDQELAGEPPDFIKMDIEGAELDALRGAAGLLRRGPSLAICLYHAQHHLWAIPLLAHAHLRSHRLLLRYHGTDAWELVLYAVM
jgi:FkbM family methyltransferase